MNRQTVRFCEGCGQMFDDLQPEGGGAQWFDARAYLMKYGFHWDDLDRVDDACPSCMHIFRAEDRQSPAAQKETRPA